MKRTEYVKLIGDMIVISPEPEEGFYPAEVDYIDGSKPIEVDKEDDGEA